MTKRFADTLVKQGHTVEIIVVESFDAQPGEPFCQTEVDGQLTVHRLFIESKHATSPLSLSYCNEPISQWYSKQILESKPDVVHLLSGYLITGCILETAFTKNIPTVVTLVDYWFICPMITLMRTDGKLCEHPVDPARCDWCLKSHKRRYRVFDELFNGAPGHLYTELNKRGLLRHVNRQYEEVRYIERRRDYNRYILENVDVVVTHSHFLENKLYEYGIQPKHVYFFPNGIEIDSQFLKGSRSIDKKDTLRIGYMGQIATHKGVDVLVEAYCLMNPQPGQSELVIYGDLNSWPDYVAQLKKLASGRTDIIFAGPYQGSDTARVMRECDVIAVPSVWYENRPTVILEAFAYGTPVIASNLGGLAEMIRHDVDGLQFEPGNPQSLAVQLRRLLDEPDLLPRLASGIDKVIDVVDELDGLVDLYQQLVAAKAEPEEL